MATRDGVCCPGSDPGLAIELMPGLGPADRYISRPQLRTLGDTFVVPLLSFKVGRRNGPLVQGRALVLYD